MDKAAQGKLKPIEYANMFLDVGAGIVCLLGLFGLLALIAIVALALSFSAPWEENERYENVPNPAHQAPADIDKHLL